MVSFSAESEQNMLEEDVLYVRILRRSRKKGGKCEGHLALYLYS